MSVCLSLFSPLLSAVSLSVSLSGILIIRGAEPFLIFLLFSFYFPTLRFISGRNKSLLLNLVFLPSNENFTKSNLLSYF